MMSLSIRHENGVLKVNQSSGPIINGTKTTEICQAGFYHGISKEVLDAALLEFGYMPKVNFRWMGRGRYIGPIPRLHHRMAIVMRQPGGYPPSHPGYLYTQFDFPFKGAEVEPENQLESYLWHAVPEAHLEQGYYDENEFWHPAADAWGVV
ncbi:hypothetical protein Lumi_096 [Xylophilus phage Lumi]|nr:hypothetical protein Lumi_096 [Xylophilus phage Lumi]